ncbi:hypothetical protein F3J37_01285 [Pantoea sp. Al-1710]|uniref:Co-chaperone DjlA N-terminal domain-containing protein n=1 Tax=Candidatus Pantoea communis TaxID=2608354 RepID=A0ABX0RI33_9GAMM|nr:MULTISPECIES: hypothetical protein [Pantoea]NIG12989.1 hypothetical protein [Pantoea sp. Cy-640]NIG17310.1 hypothetical protein [Pantoea communis]
MYDSPGNVTRDEQDIIFGIILIDAIYLIGFAEHAPTTAQIRLIQNIRRLEPILQNHRFINDIIAVTLEEKLANDFKRTANRILLNISRIITSKDRCEKILDYAQQVALAGKTISPTVQTLLDRLNDALGF